VEDSSTIESLPPQWKTFYGGHGGDQQPGVRDHGCRAWDSSS